MLGKELEFLKLSGRQLMTKRLRVALTVIGIAIGVAAVIGIVALGDGIRYQAIETIKAQSDLTLIEVHPKTSEGITQLITEARMNELRSTPHVTAVAPVFTDSYTTKRQTFLQVLAVRSDEIDRVDPSLPVRRKWSSVLPSGTSFSGTRGSASGTSSRHWSASTTNRECPMTRMSR